MAPNSEAVRIRTYGNFRRPTTAGLLGLGSWGTGVLFAGLITVVLVVMVAGLLWGAVTFGIVAGVLATVAVRDQHGSSVLDRVSARIAYHSAARRGAHLYRSGPLGMTPWGTCQLPGIAASLRLSEHIDAYGRRFALVHCPSTATFTVVISCEPDGAALVDQPQIDTWVADWGHWLANLGEEPGVEAATVTIETAPDSGHRLAHEVAGSMDPNAPTFAKAMLAEIVDTYPSGSSIIQAWVAGATSAVLHQPRRVRAEFRPIGLPARRRRSRPGRIPLGPPAGGSPPKPSSASKPCGDPGNRPASTPPPASAPGSATTPTTTWPSSPAPTAPSHNRKTPPATTSHSPTRRHQQTCSQMPKSRPRPRRHNPRPRSITSTTGWAISAAGDPSN